MVAFIDERPWWRRVLDRVYLGYLRLKVTPLHFEEVTDGELVGESVEISCLLYHDMYWNQLLGGLTTCRLLEGRPMNAFRILTYKQAGTHRRLVTVQPMHIPELPSS